MTSLRALNIPIIMTTMMFEFHAKITFEKGGWCNYMWAILVAKSNPRFRIRCHQSALR